MFYVTCPHCQAQVEIPAEAVGPDRSDTWNVTLCYECGWSFDYEDDEVLEKPDAEQRVAACDVPAAATPPRVFHLRRPHCVTLTV